MASESHLSLEICDHLARLNVNQSQDTSTPSLPDISSLSSSSSELNSSYLEESSLNMSSITRYYSLDWRAVSGPGLVRGYMTATHF